MKIGYRLELHTAMPDDWFICGTHKDGPTDRFGQQQDYWFFVLRLPSWQFQFSFAHYCDTWQQLALLFHGRRGFSFQWLQARPVKI